MSQRFPGGFITKDAVAPTPSAAKGVWTLDQQMQAQKAGTWPFGGPFNYIEDVFSTYLYDGNGSTQTITNGIDLSTNGGLVWTKNRSNVNGHALIDTVRGGTNYLGSNNIFAQDPAGATTFNSTGYALGNANSRWNAASPETYVSWTFREQPKFFDIVTWSGNDASNRQIAHNLGSVPGCIIARPYNNDSDWSVYHRSLGATKGLYLNLTQAEETNTQWGNTTPTSSVFTTNLNGAGNTYIAYLFAHDAGGFGASATDNVISCGSYITDGSGNATVNLGYEPQWILVKVTNGGGGSWILVDNMRGLNANSGDQFLRPNTSAAETALGFFKINATGFTFANGGGNPDATYIYIAIRRGPMKVPTVGTSVFALDTLGGTSPNPPGFNAGFPVDLGFFKYTGGVSDWSLGDRLRGAQELYTNLTSAEVARADFKFDYQDGWLNSTGVSSAIQSYNFRRAPSFFDEVCYTGTGVATTQTHNLGVVPEMMILKRRSSGADWPVYHVAMGPTKYTFLDGSTELTSSLYWNDTAPTASVFTIGTTYRVNASASTYVAYLFATCAGVSKVGSYTGTGATQTIACGFAAGARFVLIHRIDSGSNDWYVWDSARGMVSGTDPSLLLNSTAAEVNANSVYAITTGFQIVSTAAGINASGGTYIFLAIA
jgi:hypothetical protein